MCLACAVRAQEPVDAYNRGMARVARDERDYWQSYPAASRKALLAWRQSHLQPMRDLYERLAALEARRGRLDIRLARGGEPAAAFGKLLDELFAVADRIDTLDRDLIDPERADWSKPVDQAPAIRRHALAFRRDHLVSALARVRGAVSRLAEAWNRATKLDGDVSTVRRVAVLDALGATRKRAALVVLTSHLKDEQRPIRVAALENAARFGEPAHDDVAPLLLDEDPVVRRALLRHIRVHEPTNARWVDVVIKASAKLPPAERPPCLETLRVMLTRDIGGGRVAGALNKVTYSSMLELIGNTPHISKIGGVATDSIALWFILDGRRRRPALEAQVTGLVKGLPPRARFGLDLLHTGETGSFGPFQATEAHKEGGRLFLQQARTPRPSSPLRPLLRALETGMDSVFLVGDGASYAGPVLLPDAALKIFERRNRFRRVTVHCLFARSGHGTGRPFLEKLAEASGGKFKELD